MDITKPMTLSTSTPEEAADNLENSNLLNIGADIFKNYKTDLLPELEKQRLPSQAEPKVGQFVSESFEQAALLKPDIEKMNYFERQTRLIGDYVGKRRTNTDRLVELNLKKMWKPDDVTLDDEVELVTANDEAKNFSNYGLDGPIETLPAEIAGQIATITNSMGLKNAATIAAGTAAGAGVGAFGGAPLGPPGMVAAGVTGAITGFKLSSGAVLATKSFDMQSALVFNELSNTTTQDGKEIDFTLKRNLSVGVGVIGAAVDVAIGSAIAKTIPGLRTFFTPRLAKDLILNPASEALARTISSIGQATATGGVGNMIQEVTAVMAEELGSAGGDISQARFLDALKKAEERIYKAGVVGAGTAATISVAAGTANKKSIEAEIRNNNDAAFDAATDVTPKPNDPPPTPQTYDGQILIPLEQRAEQAIHVETVLNNLTEVGKTTKAAQLSKDAYNSLRQRIFDDSSLRYLYMDPEDIAKFVGNDEARANRIQNLLVPNQVSPESTNAHVQVQTHKILELMDDYPQLGSLVRVDPTLPSAEKAKEYLENLAAAAEKRKELIKKLGGSNLLEDRVFTPESAEKGTEIAKLETLPIEKITLKNGIEVELRPKIQPILGFDGKYNYGEVDIEAYVGDKKIGAIGPTGNFKFDDVKKEYDKTKFFVKADGLYVDKEFQRQGIASGMYDYVQKYIGDIEPSPIQTDDARAFWEDRNKKPKIKPNTKKQIMEDISSEPGDSPYDDIQSVRDYMFRPSIPPEIEAALPAGDVVAIESARVEVRKQIAESIDEINKLELDRVRDFEEVAQVEEQRLNELEAMKDDPSLEIVDAYTDMSRYQTVDGKKPKFGIDALTKELTAAHHKQGYSPFAIDPRTLTNSQKNKYLGNKQLKKNRTFVNGGISPDLAAQYMGVSDGTALLDILSKTMNRQEIASTKAELKRTAIRDDVNDLITMEKADWVKAYSNKTKNYLDEMKLMKDQKWSATKKEIKRIALPLPRIEEVSYRAKSAVQNLTVGELRPNTYKMAERRSNRKALEEWGRGDLYKAFENKGKAALNSELTKEIHMAIGRVNRTFKFAKVFRNKEVQIELKKAGPLYVNAVNEILEVFKLDPSKKGLAEKGSFNKWAEKMAETGEGNFDIPDRLASVALSGQDMTVEQVLLVGDRLRTILHKARYKNKLYSKFEVKDTVMTIDGIAAKLHQDVIKHPGYDTKNSEIQVNESNAKEFFSSGIASLSRAEHLLNRLDNGQVAGDWYNAILKPLKSGEDAVIYDTKAVKEYIEKQIKEYNSANTEDAKGNFKFLPKFEDINTIFYEIEELKSIPGYRNGKVSHGQLLMVLMNMGNEGNIKAVENSGLSRDTWMKILEDKLDRRDIRFAQSIWNTFDSFKEKVGNLEKQTNGIVPDFVEAKPLSFKGKDYPGGYFRIFYNNKPTAKKAANKLLGIIDVSKLKLAEEEFANYMSQSILAGQAMTKQGYLEARTGSDEFINLNTSNIGRALEEVIQDIHLRMPIRDVARVLANETVRNDATAVIGVRNYVELTHMVADAANSAQMRNLAEVDNTILKWMNHLNAGIQSVLIVGKATSMAVQLGSLPTAAYRMGDGTGLSTSKAALNMLDTMSLIVGNFDQYNDFVNFAAEIHTPILAVRENIDANVVNSINRMMPDRDYGKAGNLVARSTDFINEIGFGALGQVDQFNKTVVVLSAYRQAIAGNAKGIPAGDPAAAKEYARSVVRLTQTAGSVTDLAPIQKSPMSKLFLLFYNDASNLLNNTIHVANTAKDNVSKLRLENSKGETKKAAGVAKTTASQIMTFMGVLMVIKLFENLVRGQPTPFDGKSKSAEEEMKKWTKFYFGSTSDAVLGSIPVVRDVNFAAGKEFKLTKDVMFPANRALSDFATAIPGILSFLDLSIRNGKIRRNRNMTDEEFKAVLYSAGYIGKFPADAIYKYIITPDFPTPPLLKKGSWEELSDKVQTLLKMEEKEEIEIDPQLLEELREIEKRMNPESSAAEIPENTTALIRQIESNNKWWAQNPKSSAAGLYQFTAGTWRDIMNRSDLELTEDGRISSDTSQQEAAMEWFTKENVKQLSEAGIEITEENIYAAHFLGASSAVKVLTADSDLNLSTLVGGGVMEANDFNRDMTVKDFKNWLNRKIQKAVSEIDKTQQNVEG